MSSNRDPIQYTSPTDKNVEQLNVLNSAVLPVRYGPAFYKHVASDASYVSFVALFNEILVGGVTGRKLKNKEGKTYMYIMTISVLPVYRSRGIGGALLKKLEAAATADKDIAYLELHVQTGNDEALKFYDKHEYKNIELIEEYYQKVKPASAHRLTKEITRA